MNVLYRNKEVYPQIDEPFRCIDIYNRKASVPLWVYPLTHQNTFDGNIIIIDRLES